MAAAVDQLHPALVHHLVNSLGWSDLRPLQSAAVPPLLDGVDALLVAPTAGGKTEAAVFPLLSAMTTQQWTGLSVLYVCPLRALLNNLEPRLSSYAGWLGRRAAVWHGDTPQSVRQRLLAEPPDLLLTTPESIESMLVSTRVRERELFADLRVVVVDEVHAFGGDDRGWHLLAVLARLEQLAGHPLQRIGLSATVGNPAELLAWLQGSDGERAAVVVAADVETAAPSADVQLDYVGGLENAATVIASLHGGEKRLVFCESRRAVEELALYLRGRDVMTFLSHSSLSVEERRQAEAAFTESRDCVIVSTSTLELGIDVGDLDRVIQIDAPPTVASFLQRLGRTGRRPGSVRNVLILATRADALLHAAGLLLRWEAGWVEPVVAPPDPRHIVAQQILALCLQQGRVGRSVVPAESGGLPVPPGEVGQIVDWLVESGRLDDDNGMLQIGPETERRYGRRNFLELLAVFTANPEITVLEGRREIGSVDPLALTVRTEGPRYLTLAGRSWHVVHVDWKRRRCHVESAAVGARMRWKSSPRPISYELTRARRDVLLGNDPASTLSRRAVGGLAELRDERQHTVSEGATVIVRDGDDIEWWTWAGARANAVLIACLPGVADPTQRLNNEAVRLLGSDPAGLREAIAAAEEAELPSPTVDDTALAGLKFADTLPPDLARRTLARRLSDEPSARQVLAQPRVWLAE